MTDTSNTITTRAASSAGDVAGESSDEIDLDAMEADLAAVERALVRLADGTYWTDEVTGDAIPDEVLAADPTARRVAQG